MATSASRGASKPADPAGRLKRTGWSIALALVAVLMLRDSLAYVVRPADPALALRIDPANAEVQASRAEQLLRESPTNRAAAEALARRALRRSPVSAAGARMIATARDVAGDPAAARRLIAYAESLSQRDLPTQVWLIQDAVQHNDVPRALHHYDIALRSSDASKPLLLPVLVSALGQPAVVTGLIDTIAARPEWASLFLAQAAHESQDMDGLAALIAGLDRRGYPVPIGVTAEASRRMADAGLYGIAWEVFASAHPHAAPAAIHDPEFQRLGTVDGPFAWTIVPGNGLSVEQSRYGAHGALAYRALTGAGGMAARQLLMLPAGGFRLSGAVPERADGTTPPALRLTCAGSGQPIATIATDKPAFAQPFVVPAACPAQWLDVMVDGGDNPIGASGSIGSLRIVAEGADR